MLNTQLLYSNLLELCKSEDSPFYYVDHKLGDNHYRVFTYRLAQYSDFLKEGALECRGHMFHINPDGTFIGLASLPPQKFFNYQENPFTTGLDLSNGADLVMTKEDGSLISSYWNGGMAGPLRLKSKTALASEQAIAALDCLAKDKYFYNFVFTMTYNNYTVNMEFTSPHFRIVVPHQEERLTVLNIRSNITGEYMPYAVIKKLMLNYQCEEYLVQNHLDGIDDLQTFVDSVPELNNGMEGYVVRLHNGMMFKVKTNAYIALHRMKDSLGSQKRLFEVVVNEAHDDAKAAFADDPFVISQIEDMEKKVAAIWVKLKQNVIEFYNANKELDRKSYALKGQAELDRMYFGLAMTLYLGKEPEYKEWMLKHYKELGIKDDVKPVDNDE